MANNPFVPQTATVDSSISSRWTTNPKHMPLAAFASTDVNLKNGTAAVQLSSVAGFYTSLALRGASSAITVAATLVTVVNVTGGSGFLVNLISPTHTASFTPTFIVTIDGVAYTISPSATLAANRRLVLGPVVYGIPTTTALGSAALVDHFHDSNGVADAGFNAALSGGVPSTNGMTCGIPTPEAVINFGLPALRFEQSLKVEMMASLLSANAVDKQCGATYRLDL